MKRVILAFVVGIVTLLVCIVLGDALRGTEQHTLVSIGDFLGNFCGLIGVLAGIWFYFTHPSVIR